jgi:hypothetical protein
MLIVLAPSMVAAQSEAPDCVAIVAEMLSTSPSAGAIRASAGCPSTGPVTLANRWTRRGARTATERATLVEASSWVRDARLYDAVSRVVRDESYPSLDRRAGLQVLVGYAERYTVSQQGQARDAKATDHSSARRDESATISGSVPLRPTVRDDIRRDLSRLASDDRDPDVRWAARRAGESLGYELAPTRKAAVNRKP